MLHDKHTEQAAHLAGKPNCKSGKKMNWQKKGGNKPKPRQIMLCFFKLHNTPSLLVTVSSTHSIDSSWILRNSISDVKNARILFLWNLMQLESTGFLSSYWICCWLWGFNCLKTDMKILAPVVSLTEAFSRATELLPEEH